MSFFHPIRSHVVQCLPKSSPCVARGLGLIGDFVGHRAHVDPCCMFNRSLVVKLGPHCSTGSNCHYRPISHRFPPFLNPDPHHLMHIPMYLMLWCLLDKAPHLHREPLMHTGLVWDTLSSNFFLSRSSALSAAAWVRLGQLQMKKCHWELMRCSGRIWSFCLWRLFWLQSACCLACCLQSGWCQLSTGELVSALRSGMEWFMFLEERTIRFHNLKASVSNEMLVLNHVEPMTNQLLVAWLRDKTATEEGIP